MLRFNSDRVFVRGSTRFLLAGMIYAVFFISTGRTAEAGILQGINHTHWAINRFSVDGRSGLDAIGPWQGGGGGHYSVPGLWHSGLKVRVDWQTGIAFSDDVPGFEDWPKYMEWRTRVNSQKRQHSRLVHVPEYTAHSACGLTVHFLPCDEIQLTTSCYGYGHPDYPIKTPLRLPEPQSCPASSASIPAQGAQQ